MLAADAPRLSAAMHHVLFSCRCWLHLHIYNISKGRRAAAAKVSGHHQRCQPLGAALPFCLVLLDATLLPGSVYHVIIIISSLIDATPPTLRHLHIGAGRHCLSRFDGGAHGSC